MTALDMLSAATALLYLLASVCYHVHLFAGSEKARGVAALSVAAGVAAHTAAIGLYCAAGGRVLQGVMPFSLAAYFLAIGQMGANLRRTWSSLGSLSMPLAFVLEFYTSGPSPAGGAAAAAVPGILRPHVMVLLIGFTAFALSFCLAVIYLVQSRLLKTKQVRGLFSRLPPLARVSTAAHWLATVGFSMLTLGIATGALVAREAWGSGWLLDPRTLSSVAAWLIYAAYMGVSMGMGWRGRRTTYFLIAGFLVVLAAFFTSVARTSPKPEQSAAGHRSAAGRSHPPAVPPRDAGARRPAKEAA